ncbi:hypothetical protein E1B28_011150 [Marasmius oreades]|uniref:Uncharacterized protein n=1 Tax=Marasmius oreades TaxID=181124 RepID=A0A9P7UPW9_9AGAR|nr:uncharacterized protein E1B28_011150 [Marasmius oreades]KAG7089465.1 hypothetical protein E1B28_011150 [Marasmius oreades]
MSSVRTTPASEKSIYFDAPIAHFHMQSLDPEKPIPKPDASEPGAGDLSREPTVAIGGLTARKPAGNVTNGDGLHREEDVLEDVSPVGENIAAHPNGSEGWLPAEDVPTESNPAKDASKPARASSVLRKKRRSASVASRASASATSLHRHRSLGAGSTRSVSKSTFMNADGKPINGSTFINGAGTTGPASNAIADESLHQRHATADSSLRSKQRSKIEKLEAKDGKLLSKIIKKEGKVEKQALGVAINELAELQKIQQAAVKREAKSHTQHTKAVAAFTKAEAAYLEARTKFETAQALMNAEQENLEIARNAAMEATAKMQEKSQEVDSLRQTFGVDERERAVKIGELSRSTSKRKSWF